MVVPPSLVTLLTTPFLFPPVRPWLTVPLLYSWVSSRLHSISGVVESSVRSSWSCFPSRHQTRVTCTPPRGPRCVSTAGSPPLASSSFAAQNTSEARECCSRVLLSVVVLCFDHVSWIRIPGTEASLAYRTYFPPLIKDVFIFSVQPIGEIFLNSL